MLVDAAALFGGIMAQCWRFFNEWYLPGTHMTAASLFLFVVVGFITLRFFKRVSTGDDDRVK